MKQGNSFLHEMRSIYLKCMRPYSHCPKLHTTVDQGFSENIIPMSFCHYAWNILLSVSSIAISFAQDGLPSQAITLCEGESAQLTCPSKLYVLQVKQYNVFWGRKNAVTCPSTGIKETTCFGDHGTATAKVMLRFIGKGCFCLTWGCLKVLQIYPQREYSLLNFRLRL